MTRVVQWSRCSWKSCFSLVQRRACSRRPAPSAGRILHSTFQLAATVTQIAISICRCSCVCHCIDRKAESYQVYLVRYSTYKVIACAPRTCWQSRYCISDVSPCTRLLPHAHQALHLSIRTWWLEAVRTSKHGKRPQCRPRKCWWNKSPLTQGLSVPDATIIIIITIQVSLQPPVNVPCVL